MKCVLDAIVTRTMRRNTIHPADAGAHPNGAGTRRKRASDS